MPTGIVDIGSNTMRLVLYDIGKGRYKKLISKKKMTGLAGYVTDGQLSSQGVKKLIKTLNSFKKTAQAFQIKRMYYFATASLRNIDNSKEVLKKVKKETGICIELISGEEEGYLDYYAVSQEMHLEKGILIDVGGGSSELVGFRNGKVLGNKSLPIGSLSLYRQYVHGILPTLEERKEMQKVIDEQLQNYGEIQQRKTMIGIGGSVRAAHMLIQDLIGTNKRENKFFREDLIELLHMMEESEKEFIRQMLKRKPDRLHTIVPGILIVGKLMDFCGSEEIFVSDVGIREGFLKKRVMEE
ncbi:Ppx/GppA phosphatase family protein [Anaerostipes sp.]|uniref:Ppx/GppA phosphatase family protein n=1 Tax=Anaerostipes sp. TaxID=1872530 RepID=UPI003FEDC0EE